MNLRETKTMSSRPKPFMDRLLQAIERKGAPVVVGLDPRPELFPPDIIQYGQKKASEIRLCSPGDATADKRIEIACSIVRFNELMIDAVADIAVAVKPQLAFYERWGWPGLWALEQTLRKAKKRDLPIIADGKRNDIGSTAAAYAQAYLQGPTGGDGDPFSVASGLEADALTINPYLGTDSIEPFLTACRTEGKGVFVLVRTSNASGAELQQLPTTDGDVAERVADMIVRWNDGLPKVAGYGPVGAVVGATHPKEAKALRRKLPGVMLLVPGYGVQGAGAADAKAAFTEDGRGAIVNSARGILYAWEAQRPDHPGSGDEFAVAARRAALAMRDELRAVLGRSD